MVASINILNSLPYINVLCSLRQLTSTQHCLVLSIVEPYNSWTSFCVANIIPEIIVFSVFAVYVCPKYFILLAVRLPNWMSLTGCMNTAFTAR